MLLTKSCLLTENEIEELMMHHGRNLDESTEGRLERMNYLHKRLKSFKEPEIKSDNSAAGWTNQPAPSTGEAD